MSEEARSAGFANEQGDLCGEIQIPMKVGTVGGSHECPAAHVIAGHLDLEQKQEQCHGDQPDSRPTQRQD